MSQGGEGKGERVCEVQNDIRAKPFRKNKILNRDQSGADHSAPGSV